MTKTPPTIDTAPCPHADRDLMHAPCKCWNAVCSVCGRHRIDTSSIGRHLRVAVAGALVCHDCAEVA